MAGGIPGFLRLTLLFLSASGSAYGNDEFNDEDFKVRLWDCSGELRGSFGYKDNVLLSHTDGRGSAFWMSAAELMVFRLPSKGWQFHFFADASDVRYLESPSVDSEQMAIAAAQLSKDFGNGWKSAAGLNYLYQNQVFDFSDLYTNRASVGQIAGHTLSPRWSLRQTIGAYWAEAEFSGARQWLAEPLDAYWQFGPRAVLGRRWERGSELTMSCQYWRLDYDTREQVNRLGGVLTNSSLALNSLTAELALTHVWDAKRRWQTTSSLGFEASSDNGSGFYDYDACRLTQQIRYRDGRWDVTIRARMNHFDYRTQTIAAADADRRKKTMLNVTLRAERNISGHLKAHASYILDRSISNLDFDDYMAQTVLGGLAVTF